MSESLSTKEPKAGTAKNWYVIHTYAGFEGRVKTSLLERANQMSLTDKMGQVLVPTEDVIEIKDGKRRTSRRKFFPGYVLVELETPLTDETLQMIKETPKVTGFVGGGGAAASVDERRSGRGFEAGRCRQRGTARASEIHQDRQCPNRRRPVFGI